MARAEARGFLTKTGGVDYEAGVYAIDVEDHTCLVPGYEHKQRELHVLERGRLGPGGEGRAIDGRYVDLVGDLVVIEIFEHQLDAGDLMSVAVLDEFVNGHVPLVEQLLVHSQHAHSITVVKLQYKVGIGDEQVSGDDVALQPVDP
jgi:hypothetical protein